MKSEIKEEKKKFPSSERVIAVEVRIPRGMNAASFLSAAHFRQVCKCGEYILSKIRRFKFIEIFTSFTVSIARINHGEARESQSGKEVDN